MCVRDRSNFLTSISILQLLNNINLKTEHQFGTSV